MKSKSLASQDYSYGILFMDGKNMIAEISAQSSIFSLYSASICAPQSLVNSY